MTRSKYGAKPVVIDGIRWASKKEGKRYCELKLMARAGVIDRLNFHSRHKLIVNGIKVGTYESDFDYYEVETGNYVIEDVKGVKTPVYKLKKMLMNAIYNIDIKET